MSLRFLTAGESHGKALTTIVEGMPSGVPISKAKINQELARRQRGAGRGGRMKIEQDQVEILSGIRAGVSTGAPISLQVFNRDWERWQEVLDPQKPSASLAQIEADARIKSAGAVTVPRPGHADLAGGIKYNHKDLRNILERASARETVTRVLAGSLARIFLAQSGVELASEVIAVGGIESEARPLSSYSDATTWEELKELDETPLRCGDPRATEKILALIKEAKENGDSLGGSLRVVARGLVPGLGSHVHWERRLDGQLAGALMSIGAVKAVWVGEGTLASTRPGSHVHDEIRYRDGFRRESNNAGGLEGGITTGEPLILGAALKPIPTLYNPLMSVDVNTKKEAQAQVERSDTCVVPAAAVIAEAMLAIVLANAYLEKFGGDTLEDFLASLEAYKKRVREY